MAMMLLLLIGGFLVSVFDQAGHQMAAWWSCFINFGVLFAAWLVGLAMKDKSVGDPTKAAASFADEMRREGFLFDFTLASLETEVDRLLCSGHFKNHSNPQQWATEAGLEAYVGEVLRIVFDGEWKGAYRADNPGPNFYCSWIEFGEYVYRPSHFLGYRISNGEEEGTFSQHLAQVLPFLKARENQFRPGAS